MSARGGRHPGGPSWRARSSLAEGLSNLRDGALLATALVAFTAGLTGSALLADMTAAARILHAESSYLDSGGDLLVARHPQSEPLDAAACTNLGEIAGVRAAAAVDVTPAAAALVGRPESQQTLVTATDGVLDLFDLDALDASDALVAPTIAERWQWSPGTRFQLTAPDALRLGAPAGVLRVAAVVDLGRLEEAASTGVLLLRPATGATSTCYVRIEPQYRQDLRAAIPAALGETATSPIQVLDRRAAGAFAQDPAAAYAQRSTRWAGSAAGVIAGLLWALVAWTRRGRAALYASIGVPYTGGVLIRWTEGGTALLLGVLWGTALAVAGAVALAHTDIELALHLGGRGGLAAGTSAIVIVVLAGLWRPQTLTALKDR